MKNRLVLLVVSLVLLVGAAVATNHSTAVSVPNNAGGDPVPLCPPDGC